MKHTQEKQKDSKWMFQKLAWHITLSKQHLSKCDIIQIHGWPTNKSVLAPRVSGKHNHGIYSLCPESCHEFLLNLAVATDRGKTQH